MFVLDLAVSLHKSIEQVEAMSSREFSEWMAYSRIKALPDAHWDAASVAYTIASIMSGKGARPKFDDFLPRPVRRKQKTDSKGRLDVAQTRGLISKLCGIPVSEPK